MPGILSCILQVKCKMEAIVFISLQIFFAPHAVLKIGNKQFSESKAPRELRVSRNR